MTTGRRRPHDSTRRCRSCDLLGGGHHHGGCIVVAEVNMANISEAREMNSDIVLLGAKRLRSWERPRRDTISISAKACVDWDKPAPVVEKNWRAEELRF